MIDWDDAFDNSGYVEGSAGFGRIWAQQAAATRETLALQADLSYGASERHQLDLFLPEGEAKGLVVFVHGGYWHKLDKSYWSHLAQGPVGCGWAVAIPSYPLAPLVHIGEITTAISEAISFAAQHISGPIRLTGHSAGGHLVARMASATSPLSTEIRERVARVVSISGVHDLRPLTLTEMNRELRLTEAEALLESPALLAPLTQIPVTFWVGANERPEFLRQNRLIAEKWEQQGADVTTVYDRGKNHFSVISSLSQPDGVLTQELLR
ncbi:MAG: alpha/beta hydrolase [Thiolinea sp.]